MKNLPIFFLSTFLFASCTPSSQAPPLLDGKIEDYQRLGVEPINLADSVDLYIYQDAHYVWLAYSYPTGSYGTMDMVISTEKLAEPLNLHVSAQVGEWLANKPETAPQTPQSDMWWNQNGWYANEIWPNGMDYSGETPDMNFKNAPARELQLSKERFGRGEWKINLEIRAIQGPDGFITVPFPEGEESYSLKVN